MGYVYSIYDLRANTMDRNTTLRDPMSETEFAECQNNGVSPRLYAVRTRGGSLRWLREGDPGFTARAVKLHKLVGSGP